MRFLIQRPAIFVLLISLVSFSQSPQPPFPVKRTESAETWRRDGWNYISNTKNLIERKGIAKNVILFLGDGMGISTITASRIFEGQTKGESGEENLLSFEEFPYRPRRFDHELPLEELSPRPQAENPD